MERASMRVTCRLLAVCAAMSCVDDPGNAAFSVRGSVLQVHVWKAAPGAELELRDGETVVASGTADVQGSKVFRKVPAGRAYRVHSVGSYSAAVRVYTEEESTPARSSYASQKLVRGFQYLTMRDGVTLSAYVTMPGPEDEGPYPTVVNYSGYAPSEPGAPVEGFEDFCGVAPVFCDAPNAEGSLFAAFLGYATVNVNMRGTGCSGGAYDYFETLQLLDGYDVIETVAAQPWVLHHKVGMQGLSYPGITQLFVAARRPPGLAAITPLSVIGATTSTLVPGGILNDGFALNWVDAVLDKAAPYGQGWERARVDGGDTTCEENQLLHSQRVDNVQQARDTPFHIPELIDPLDPVKFVDRIEVPVFIAGAWQDEQTGPFFGDLLDRFERSPSVRITVQNGVHPDAYTPAILAEWAAFLDLFVARRVPQVPEFVRSISGAITDEVFGESLPLPADRWGAYATHDAALAAWMAEPRVRILFESGAGDPAKPGAPVAAFEKTFPRWPPAPQTVERWHLAPGGALAASATTEASSASRFTHDPGAGARGILAPGTDVWDSLPAYDWRAPVAGSAVAFDSAPLDDDRVMAGPASADLWIRSSATEADLEVNLSELRPDGRETYVQSGWLRASHRFLDSAGSTDLRPVQTHLESDHAPLVPGEWTFVRVAIAPFSHAFRKDSRLRITVDTPGDSRADWRFALATVPEGTVIDVGHDAAHPSSVALPLLEGVTVPTALPGCVLRGQQCRDTPAIVNAPAP